ncbi:MAG TPA: host attachment protein [Burkholderiaceae bacterium]|nr:host attachment protein [Burkholderiaceae bacterium]
MSRLTWIVIANSAHARVLSREQAHGPVTEVARFEHPGSRLRGADIVGDRAGYEAMGGGHGSASFAPRTDPRTKEHENFARQLAREIGSAVGSGRCGGVALMASNPFLGEVKGHLDVASQKALVAAVPVDLTSFDGEELQRRIDAALARPD